MNNEVCYAVAINAHKQTAHGTKIEIKAGGVWACSDEEASGKALALAKSEWPTEDGWYTHGGVWAKFPKEERTSNLAANVWRELWYRVLADKLFPWEPDVDTTMYHCTFCGHSKPGHKPTCPYVQAQALASKEMNMNNLTIDILDVYGLEIVGRYVGLPVNKVLSDVHPDDQHIPAHKLNTLTKLISAGDEHASIMRQVNAHLLIRAPRYWWVQFDKYQAGVCMYSSSTMHTLLKQIIDETGFTSETSPDARLALLKALDGGLVPAKANLPEGYLQTRLVLVSYQTLRRIWRQRKTHKLSEWAEFIQAIRGVPYADELIFVEPKNPWRKLWDRILADEYFPWIWDAMTEETICVFCGHEKPGHQSICPYAKAQSMIIKEITDVVTE